LSARRFQVVVAGLVPAIYAFAASREVRRGCPAQGRAWRVGAGGGPHWVHQTWSATTHMR